VVIIANNLTPGECRAPEADDAWQPGVTSSGGDSRIGSTKTTKTRRRRGRRRGGGGRGEGMGM